MRSYIGLRRPSVLAVYRMPPLIGAPSPVACGFFSAYGAAALVRYQSYQTDVKTGFVDGPDISTRGFVLP